ncbi:hypothetical protein XENOCAPTIV_022270 [Xenoophorus captivus]|uniref:Uncharacterized protein n=1 Tax=Xenoophorus captivus TaxID=1517983 RepID=A0ABV0RUP4_9TELE
MMLEPPCFTVFRVYCGFSPVFGVHLKIYLHPLDPKRAILLSPVHEMFLHFSLPQFVCSLENILFITLFFFLSGTLRRLLANRLASHKLLLPCFSGFGSVLKYWETILAEQAIIFCTSL